MYAIPVSLVHGKGLFFSITRGTKVCFIAWNNYFKSSYKNASII